MIMPNENILKAVSWTLIHSVWQGLVLAVFAGLVIVFTKKSKAALRYNWLSGLFVAFMIAVGCTFYYEFQQETAAAGGNLMVSGALDTQIAMAGNAAGTPDYFQAAVGYLNQYATTIAVVWFFVFSLKCFGIFRSLSTIYKLRNYKTHPAPEYWSNKVTVLSQKLAIKKRVVLLESQLIKVPSVTGFFKPIILIPIGLLSNLPQDQIEAILLHELAHIRRKDYFINLLQNFAEILFFFNPGLLWVSSLIKAERENCCDDIAVGITQSKSMFIHALVSFQEYNMKQDQLALGFGKNKNQLLDRARRIIQDNNKSLNMVEKTFLSFCIIAVMAFSLACSNTKTAAAKKAETDNNTEITYLKNLSKESLLQEEEISKAERESALAQLDSEKAQLQAEKAHLEAEKALSKDDKTLSQLNKELSRLDKALSQLDKAYVKSNKAYARSNKGYVNSNKAYAHSNKTYVQSNDVYVNSNKTDAQGNKASFLDEKALLEFEKAREYDEIARKEHEKARKEHEKARKEHEKARKEHEKERIESEKIRKENEIIRKENEIARRESEVARKESEKARLENEKARLENEKARKENEKARLEAEKLRTTTGDTYPVIRPMTFADAQASGICAMPNATDKPIAKTEPAVFEEYVAKQNQIISKKINENNRQIYNKNKAEQKRILAESQVYSKKMQGDAMKIKKEAWLANQKAQMLTLKKSKLEELKSQKIKFNKDSLYKNFRESKNKTGSIVIPKETDNISRQIIQVLANEKAIASLDNLSYKLSHDSIIVNGKALTGNVHNKLKKFLRADINAIYYEFDLSSQDLVAARTCNVKS